MLERLLKKLNKLILKNDSGRINFIVDTLCSMGFESKGGSFAVHRLAEEIAKRGHNVYVFNDPFYPHENISVIPTVQNKFDDGWYSTYQWEGFSFDPEKTISIYTQNTWGNPFGTKHNCRWILHDYEESQWSTFSDSDLIYNYGSFRVPENTTQEKLTVFDYKLDLYKNLSLDRKGFCHIIHKFTPDWGYDFLSNFGSEDLTSLLKEGRFDDLSFKFNQFEYLLTFDSKSYITTAATLCGCKAIILNPDPEKTPLEYRLENPIQMCGVSYGWDDLEWSNKTLSLSRSNIETLEKIDSKTIDSFVLNWEKKIYNG